MQDVSLHNIWEESGNNAVCTIGNMWWIQWAQYDNGYAILQAKVVSW